MLTKILKQHTATALIFGRYIVSHLFDALLKIRLAVCIDHGGKTNRDHGTDDLVIIELKRDGNVFSPVCNLLRDIHVHPTGFSKCCIGMALTDPQLKQNNFKPKLRNLEKINGRKFIDHEI